jgi:hypothetical protein
MPLSGVGGFKISEVVIFKNQSPDLSNLGAPETKHIYKNH